jgi:RNA polymerase sigma-70 factor (ECF subfamily)
VTITRPAPEAPAPQHEAAALFAEFRQPLVRYAQSKGLPASDAEDVAQETFLHLIRHLEQGKPQDNLRGWIFRVGHNLALKRRTNARRILDIPPPDHADPAPDPEQAAAARLERMRLLAVVQALSEQDRSCLALRAEGLRYREIAAALDISLGSVAASLTRALAKLAAVRARHV